KPPMGGDAAPLAARVRRPPLERAAGGDAAQSRRDGPPARAPGAASPRRRQAPPAAGRAGKGRGVLARPARDRGRAAVPHPCAARMSRRIVGITLVRDEDLFVEQAVRNVLDFCDQALLVDHRSRDRTGEILAALAAEHPDRVGLHTVDDPSASHDLIAPLAGEDGWVFGVDGAELYDP